MIHSLWPIVYGHSLSINYGPKSMVVSNSKQTSLGSVKSGFIIETGHAEPQSDALARSSVRSNIRSSWTKLALLPQSNNRPCEDGLYQVRGDPSKFFQCFQRVKFETQSCPSWLLFKLMKIWAFVIGLEMWLFYPKFTNRSDCFDRIKSGWMSWNYMYCYDSQMYIGYCPIHLHVRFYKVL